MGWRGGAGIVWFLLGILVGVALLATAFPPRAL